MINENARINVLFRELVPETGKADSLAGELARATGRIGYRFYNDGDHIGIGYGNETCNQAARFIIKKAPKEIGDLVEALWGTESKIAYEAVLDILANKMAEYIDANPDLRNQPTDDMYDYFDKEIDHDDTDYGDDWDEDDWEWN